MKKILIIALWALLASLSSVKSAAQNSNFNMFEYSFDDDALTSERMDTTGFHSSLIWDRTYIEYIFGEGPQTGKFTLLHTLRQINDVRAVEEFNKIYIPFYGLNSPARVDARVIVNGKVVFTGDNSSTSIVEEESVKFRLMALEGVTEGCLIESVVVLPTDFDLVGSHELQDQVPSLESLVCIIVPEAVKLKYKVYNADLLIEEKVEDGRRIIYSLLTNSPAIQEEEYCHVDARVVRLDHTLDKIEGTNYVGKNWADRGIAYFDGNWVAYDKSKSGLKKFIKQQKFDVFATDQEKIFAVEDYLKRNIGIDGGSQAPEDATAALKSKVTNHFGFNRLMFLTFYELGIPVELVVTCERSQRRFDKDFPSDYGFTDVLFYFPNTKQYLDPASPTLRSPIFSNEFIGQDAVRIKLVDLAGAISGVSSIKPIPTNPYESSVMKERFTVRFSDDKQSTVEDYFKSYSGFAEMGIRGLCYFSTEEERTEFLENFIKGNFDNSKVENIKAANYDLSNQKEYNAPLELTATITGPDLLEFAGEKILLKIGEVIGQQSELYNTKPRQMGIDIETAHYYDRVITVEIPDGYKLEGLEALVKDTHVKDGNDKDQAFFTSNYKLEGNKLIINITESYNSLEIPISGYEDFAKVVNAAADFNKITLVLSKI
jgi:hypothetical protein